MGNFKFSLLVLFILGYLFSDVQSLSCWRCNSNQVADCARRPDNIDEFGENVSCPEDDLCAMAILADNSTHRGCSSEIPDTARFSDTCSDNLCNTPIYPESRLQCHQCSGSSCLTVESGSELPCTNYNEDDECFTDVIDFDDAVRGCISDGYEDTYYRRECRTNGCNNQPAVSTFSCIKCDSLNDINCKIGPNPGSECSVLVETTCDKNVLFGRIEHCFTYRNGERVVRGCSIDEPEYVTQSNFVRECILNKCNDECIAPIECYECDSRNSEYCTDGSVGNLTERDCPLGTSSCFTCRDSGSTIYRGCGTFDGQAECESCWNDPKCNNKKMNRCYSCKSTENENCMTWENIESIDQVICNGNCIATLRDEVVERGCQSNSFDCQPSLTCKSCSEDDCNDGLVPDKRLRCHQCDENDPSCVDDQSMNMAEPCSIVEDENDKCYVFVTGDNKIVRGCSTDQRYYECLASQPGKCVTCTGDGCNSQGLFGKLVCLQCDSEKDEDCIDGFTPENGECGVGTSGFCEVEVPFGEYEYCYTYRNGQRVMRGCSKLDPSISSQIKYVRECRLDNCNSECIEAAQCYACDSKTNNYCERNPMMIEQSTCQSGDISCYTCRDSDGTIRRGCGSGGTFGRCYSCWNDPGCNDKPMLECYSCNSIVDKNCADWTNPDRINKNICNGLCIAALRDGFVERGCQSNSFDCPASETCIRCDQDNCNAGLVPANRLVCHQCNSSDTTCAAEKDQSSATACTTYVPIDECFYYLDENDRMTRGCTSDASYQDCLNNKDRCITCSTPGCNNNAALKSPVLECAKCNGDDKCAWAQNEKSLCEKPIPYYGVESCYIYKSSDGSIRRGCSLDDNACNPSTDSNCVTCSISGCNYVNRVYQSCLQCTGTGEEACVSGKNITGTTCPQAVQPYETRGCYAKREGDTVTRGCLYDLNAEEKEKCEKDDKNCQACLQQDCNTKELNGGSHLSALSALFLVFIAYVVKS